MELFLLLLFFCVCFCIVLFFAFVLIKMLLFKNALLVEIKLNVRVWMLKWCCKYISFFCLWFEAFLTGICRTPVHPRCDIFKTKTIFVSIKYDDKLEYKSGVFVSFIKGIKCSSKHCPKLKSFLKILKLNTLNLEAIFIKCINNAFL